jgi:hypothetical protein
MDYYGDKTDPATFVRTVGELIARLQAFQPEQPIAVLDADTSWWLTLQHVIDDEGTIVLAADYDHSVDDRNDYHELNREGGPLENND